MKNTKTTDRSTYLLAENLSKMEIRTLEDVREFYIGINNLASEISSDSALLKKIRAKKNDGIYTLREAVNTVLVYGQLVAKNKLFAKRTASETPSAKEVSVDIFLSGNLKLESEINIIRKRAATHLSTFQQLIANLTPEEANNLIEENIGLKEDKKFMQEQISSLIEILKLREGSHKVEITNISELNGRGAGETTPVNNKKETFQKSEPEEPVVTDEEEDVKIRISGIAKKKFPDLEFGFKGGKVLLRLEKNGEWINLGGPNTRTCKMAQYIFKPTSKSKKVVDIFNAIRISTDDKDSDFMNETNQSYRKKKEIIRSVISELQKKEYLAGYICAPKFDNGEKTAIIKFKELTGVKDRLSGI